MILQHPVEHLARQRIVQRCNRAGQRLGGNALGQQIAGQVADISGNVREPLDRTHRADCVMDLPQTDALQSKQIVLEDRSENLAVRGHDHLMKAARRHALDCFSG